MTKEKITVEVEYEIRYHSPDGREDVVESILRCLPCEMSGAGGGGAYGCTRGVATLKMQARKVAGSPPLAGAGSGAPRPVPPLSG